MIIKYFGRILMKLFLGEKMVIKFFNVRSGVTFVCGELIGQFHSELVAIF